MMRLFPYYIKYRFVIVNLIFVGYLIGLQPLVLVRLGNTVNQGKPDILMGILLFGIQLFEIIGLLLKMPLYAYWLKIFPQKDQLNEFWENLNTAGLILSPIFHMGFAAILGIFALDLFGVRSASQASIIFQFCPVFVVFVIIAKEAVFTVLVLSMGTQGMKSISADRSFADTWLQKIISSPVMGDISIMDAVKDFFGDLILLIYSGLSYTVGWEFLIKDTNIEMNSGEGFFIYVGLSILFLLVFISTRIIYLMQEISIQQNSKTRIFSITSFLILWAIALSSIPAR